MKQHSRDISVEVVERSLPNDRRLFTAELTNRNGGEHASIDAPSLDELNRLLPDAIEAFLATARLRTRSR